MKKFNVILLAIIVINAIITPYAIGKIQFNNAICTIQNLQSDEFGSDADIEDVLAVFNFADVDAVAEPTFIQYYQSGVITIEENVKY